MNTSKEEFIVLRPDNEEVSQEKLFEVIDEFRKNADEIKELSKTNDANKALLKQIGTDAYLEEYKLRSENPGSVIIEAIKDNNVKSFMFIPKDQYLQIKSKMHVDDLKEKYGEDIIESSKSYTFNTKLFEKYRTIFEQFIEDSFEIEEEDKKELIKEQEKFSIKKGTIEEISHISLDTGEEIEEIFEQISVVNNIKV